MTQTRFIQAFHNSIMKLMSSGDDLDERFKELVAQFDDGEQRRMRDAATKAARQDGRDRKKLRAERPKRDEDYAPPRRSEHRWKIWLAVLLVLALVAAASVVTLLP